MRDVTSSSSLKILYVYAPFLNPERRAIAERDSIIKQAYVNLARNEPVGRHFLVISPSLFFSSLSKLKTHSAQWQLLLLSSVTALRHRIRFFLKLTELQEMGLSDIEPES